MSTHIVEESARASEEYGKVNFGCMWIGGRERRGKGTTERKVGFTADSGTGVNAPHQGAYHADVAKDNLGVQELNSKNDFRDWRRRRFNSASDRKIVGCRHRVAFELAGA